MLRLVGKVRLFMNELYLMDQMKGSSRVSLPDAVDEVWVLELPVEVAKERLMKRNSISETDVRHAFSLLSDDLTDEQTLQAQQRINSQFSHDERKKVADVIINADGTLDEVKQRVREEWKKLVSRKNLHI